MTDPSPPAASLVPIFATPFAQAALPVEAAFNQTLAGLLGARATGERHDPDRRRDPLCYVSREDLFESRDEPIAALRNLLLAGLCRSVLAATLHGEAEFSRLGLRSRARFVIVRPDGCLPAQSLALASWCAIYCVAAPPAPAGRADSGVLRLYEMRLGGMFADATTWRLRPPFAGGHQLWHPRPGSMALFPAHLLHEIALNRSDGDLMLVILRARFENPGQQEIPPW
ncbi:MAG TPA: hypothetical protein VGR80_01600 [Steroidobacteraceae bacterium]|nr:hypothetical protein [Gammaproteobacteria bacterium]HEV2284708.1 hypothetical protein [Steroidobacteraceae bacterium]